MNSESNQLISTPAAILIGSIIIALAIFVSNGTIKLKGFQPVVAGTNVAAQVTPQPNVPDQPVGKTEAQIVVGLKKYAAQLGLDQSKFNSCLDSGEKAAAVKADQNDGVTLEVGGTPSMFINGVADFKGAAPFENYKPEIEAAINGTQTGTKKNIGNGTLPALGNTSAPVTIVEFSDYQCPFCERLYSGAETQIRKEYVETGKVKIYFRDFPLTQIHPGAQKAAEAARCANDQGKFWQYHDLVFQNQSEIF